MPMDRSRYPADWDDISKRIRERDGGRCTCCGLENGTWIVRSSFHPEEYLLYDADTGELREPHFGLIVELTADDFRRKPTRVILTVHHIGVDKPDGSPGSRHDKMDCRDENLTSLCQRCHFIADLDIHIVNAALARATNKRKRQVQAGQMELWG